MPLSLAELGEEWQQHPLGRRRAVGGLNALEGFAFQIAVSLEDFIDQVRASDPAAELAFETISDLSSVKDGLYYLTQVKATLTTATAADVAEEAMAVDAFLSERHPQLRNAFSYSVRCRTWSSGDPRSVTSERLKLAGGEATRWQEVKGRILAPEVRSHPRFRLALKLFNEVLEPFALVARMTGELLRLLAARSPPPEISATLLEMLTRARAARSVEPPPKLLDIDDFTVAPGSRLISLGQRPTLQRLTSGYFMARPDRVSEVVQWIEKLAASVPEDESLVVCWLSGGSGVGKSVLLLQAQEQMVRNEKVIVHHLNPTNSALQRALEYWRSPETPVVLAIDDLFAPARRGEQQWDRFSDLAMDPARASSLIIATAGPDSYLEAFKQSTRETGAFRVEEFKVRGLDDRERTAYRKWFHHRTNVEPPVVDDSLFIVTAFRSVLSGAGASSLEEFAGRFRMRVLEMGMEEQALVCLAMNGLGLPAPEELFEGSVEPLAKLIAEDVVTTQESDSGQRVVTIFHQVLADRLYEELVPRTRTDARAQHLARAFAACGTDAPLAASVITGAATRPGNGRAILHRLLELSWDETRIAVIDQRRAAAVVAWIFTAASRGFPLEREPYSSWLVGLMAPDTPGQIFRPASIVAHRMLADSRPRILTGTREWLEANTEDPTWPQAARVALRFGLPPEIAEDWLKCHVDVSGSVGVFLRLPDSRDDFKRRHIGRMLERAPTVRYDWRLWTEATRLGVEPDRVRAAVVRRATRAPAAEVIRRAARFLTDDAGEDRAPVLRDLLLRNLDGERMPRLLRALAHAAQEHSHIADAIADVAITLLEREPEAEYWPATWQAMYVRSGRSRDRLDALARGWLTRHSTHPRWFAIALSLALRDRPRGKPNWQQVLRKPGGKRDDGMCKATAAALAAHPDAPAWPYVLVDLLAVDSSREHRDLARAWLGKNPDHLAWPNVWRQLCRRKPARDDLELGREWLARNPSHPQRSAVVTRLAQLERSRG